MSPSLADRAQEEVLAIAAKCGPAEVYLRRTNTLSAEFEGVGSTRFSEINELGLALRIHRNGRVGLAASSLTKDKEDIQQLVVSALLATAIGPRALTILASPSLETVVDDQFSKPETSETVVKTHLAMLLQWLAQSKWDALWSGRLEAAFTEITVTNSVRLKRTGMRFRWKLQLRARQRGRPPSDRVFEFIAPSWPEIINGVQLRLLAELPSDSSETAPDAQWPLAIGPSLVARVCHAILSRPVSMPSTARSGLALTDVPSGGQSGCDDEGMPLHPVAVISGGKWCPPWRLVAEPDVCTPTGRAVRVALDSPPRVVPMGLRFHADADLPSEQVLLLTELAGLQIDRDGMLSGTAPESVLLLQGRPDRRYRGRSISFQINELFSNGFAGASSSSFLVGPHLLPWIQINTH